MAALFASNMMLVCRSLMTPTLMLKTYPTAIAAVYTFKMDIVLIERYDQKLNELFTRFKRC